MTMIFLEVHPRFLLSWLKTVFGQLRLQVFLQRKEATVRGDDSQAAAALTVWDTYESSHVVEGVAGF